MSVFFLGGGKKKFKEDFIRNLYALNKKL
jgi:hypothetical protein